MAADARGSSEVDIFRCPSCGAALDVVDAPSVKCKYCGNVVLVPAELRPRQPQVVIQQVDLSSPQYVEATKAGRSLGCVIAVVVLVITIGAIGFGLYASQSAITGVQAVLQDVQIQELPDVKATINAISPGAASVPRVPTAKSAPGFAQVVQEFGTQGSEPGQLDDARYLALDSDGNIWTADYQDGRVQLFDASG